MKPTDDIHTADGKAQFIRQFMGSVMEELLAEVDKMPEEWDGFELRWLIADRFNYGTYGVSYCPRPVAAYYKRRFKKFDNERRVRNL